MTEQGAITVFTGRGIDLHIEEPHGTPEPPLRDRPIHSGMTVEDIAAALVTLAQARRQLLELADSLAGLGLLASWVRAESLEDDLYEARKVLMARLYDLRRATR